MTDAPLHLGFAGLRLAGINPQQAWQQIHQSCQSSLIQALIADLNSTEEGRIVLENSKEAWAREGLPPPWLLDGDEVGAGKTLDDLKDEMRQENGGR